MTNIDYDALARRIAERLGLSGYLRAPERLNGVWRATKENVEQSIFWWIDPERELNRLLQSRF